MKLVLEKDMSDHFTKQVAGLDLFFVPVPKSQSHLQHSQWSWGHKVVKVTVACRGYHGGRVTGIISHLLARTCTFHKGLQYTPSGSRLTTALYCACDSQRYCLVWYMFCRSFCLSPLLPLQFC